MESSQTTIPALIQWKRFFSFKSSDPEFERELAFVNFNRTHICIYGFMAVGIFYFILRLSLFAKGQDLTSYIALLFLNILVVFLSGGFALLFFKSKPKTPETVTRIHHNLVYAAALTFTLVMSVAAGFEYMATGTFTRLFFMIICICIILVINWYVLLTHFIISALTLLLTIYLSKGDLLRLGIEHMHIPVLLFIFWLISRIFYMAAFRDFRVRKRLEQTNDTLNRENLGRLKALEALKKSQGYLRTLFEKAPDAYLLFDTKHAVFTEINAYAEELFQYTNEEVAGKHYRDIEILSEEHCLLIDNIIEWTLEQTVTGPFDIGLTLRDGQKIVVEIRSSLTTRSGRTMILATARDVTWRKHAEEELRKSNTDLEQRVRERSQRVEETANLLKQEISDHKKTETVLRRTEEQSRMFLEKMNDGFVVIDMGMRIRYANERLCTMLELSSTEIVGRSFYDFVQTDRLKALNDHLNTPEDNIQGALETILKKANGGKLHVHISPRALYNGSGEIKGRFSVITDITRIKSMEEALRESEEMARALLNASRDLVMLLTPSGEILVANNMLASRLDTELDQLKGQTIFSFLKPDSIPRLKKKLEELVARKEPGMFEEAYDGMYFMVHVYPIYDSGPSIDRVAVFARDISDLKKAEKHIHSLSQELIKIQESERLRISRDLHDNVAQELASLKILCETLFDKKPDIHPDIREKMGGFSDILQHTIMSVRDMAYDLRPPGLDQLGLVRTITNYCDDYSDRGMAEVDFFSAGVSRLCLTQDTEINLYRIVQEALHNITKHAQATKITVRLTASFPTIILRIEDNGKGFDISGRMADAYTGKRMGLRSMQERVRLLSGNITFRSQKDKGTKVVVEIPIHGNIIEDKNEQGDRCYES